MLSTQVVVRRHLPALTAAALLLAAAPAGAAGSPDRLSVVAGTGTTGAPTPGPATASKLGTVFRAAAAPDGTLFLPDLTSRVIVKVDPDGDLSIIAGQAGLSGTPTEGPATDSRISSILGSAVDRDGNLYVYDSGARRILKIDTAGQLTFVAGTGTTAMPTTPLGADARSTPISTGGALAVDASGNVFFADTTRYQILKITPGGAISAVAGLGGGTDGPFAEGPALASPMDPLGLAVGPDGSLYVSNRIDFRIAKIDPSGTLSFYAGDGTNDPLEEGPRLTSSAHQPTNLQLEDDGDLLFTDSTTALIAKVTPGGNIVKVAGNGLGNGGGAAFTGDDPLANAVANHSLAATGDGRFFLSGPGGMVARVGHPEPLAPTGVTVEDGDGEVVVRFTDPSDVGSAPITAYEVSSDDGATWAPVTVVRGAARARSATVALANGGTYPVRVRVANTYGPSPRSASVVARPVAPAPLPGGGGTDPGTVPGVTPAGPGGEEPGGAVVPVAPLGALPAAAAPAVAVPASAAPAAPAVAAAAAPTCRATRTVHVRWAVPRGTSVARLTLAVNGRTRTLARGARTATLTLDPAVARRFAVVITARTADGRTLRSTREYRVCAPGTPGALATIALRPAGRR